MAIKRPNANLLKCNFHIAVACCMFAACLRCFVFVFFSPLLPIFRFVFHVAICQNARSTSAATTPRCMLPPAPLLTPVRLHRARPSWGVAAAAAAAAWQHNQFLINCKIFFYYPRFIVCGVGNVFCIFAFSKCILRLLFFFLRFYCVVCGII